MKGGGQSGWLRQRDVREVAGNLWGRVGAGGGGEGGGRQGKGIQGGGPYPAGSGGHEYSDMYSTFAWPNKVPLHC